MTITRSLWEKAQAVPLGILDQVRWRGLLWNVDGFTVADMERTFDAITKKIEAAQLEALRRSVEPELRRDPAGAAKYADHGFWLRRNIVRAASLGLHRARPSRILDIGCGPGYMLAAAAAFGHECMGLDVPDTMLSPVERVVYREVLASLGRLEERRQAAVQAFTSLPVEGRFDRITAYQVCFNNHGRDGEWSSTEWEFFLNDALRLLNPGGRLWLHLNDNRPRYGHLIWYDSPTLQLFRAFGRVEGDTITVEKGRRAGA